MGQSSFRGRQQGGTSEQLAERYEKHNFLERGRGFAVAADERGAFFAARIGSGKEVLDLGCRDGTLAAQFHGGNSVTGADIDRAALRVAEERGLETVWADLTQPLPFEDETFDAVVVGEVLEHLPDPAALVAEARRLLRPGGLIVGSVPNAFRLKNRLRFLAGRPPETDPTHLQLFSPRRIEALLADFEMVETTFFASRFLWLWPRGFANTLAFSARKMSAD
jgi:2-polyprenyl-3-methyl-5-hydroxy-6-metoxy-1,4-benzoquinol methylase